MDFRVVAEHNSVLFPVAWIGLQPDNSVSVGLSDRAFISPHFQVVNDLFNIDNRVTVKYLITQKTTGLKAVQNPHFSFHPLATLHLRETNGVRVFDGFADVAMIVATDGEMPWLRIVSRPIREMDEAGPPRPKTPVQLIEVPVSSTESSVGVAVDFIPRGQTRPTRGLADQFEDCGDVRIHVYCEEFAGQPPTLSWYHQS